MKPRGPTPTKSSARVARRKSVSPPSSFQSMTLPPATSSFTLAIQEDASSAGLRRLLRQGLTSVLLPKCVCEPPTVRADPYVPFVSEPGEHLLGFCHAQGGLQSSLDGSDPPMTLQRLKELLILGDPGWQGGWIICRPPDDGWTPVPRGASDHAHHEEQHYGKQGEEREYSARRGKRREHEQQQQPEPPQPRERSPDQSTPPPRRAYRVHNRSLPRDSSRQQ